ncbi:MAG: hypothetical protein LBT14_12850 [Treponema sp.]|jgi:hypothetical protein|nr:hypothetical protein [Treponema sp.]
METDFYDAYKRHLEDAEYLYQDSRWANADQLYGYSAECGLKCLMQRFGMQLDARTGMPPNEGRGHIDEIWIKYETYRAGIGATGYTLPGENPFDNWNISQRYANKSNFSQAIVDLHRLGVETVKQLVNKAILEGRLAI